MVFQLLDLAGEQSLVFGCVLAKPPQRGLDPFVEGPSSHAVNRQMEPGKVVAFQSPGQGLVKGGKIHLAMRWSSLRDKTRSDGIERSWIVGTDTMLRIALEIQVEHLAPLRLGLELVVTDNFVQVQCQSGFEMITLRQGKVPHVQTQGNLGRPVVGLERQSAAIVSGSGIPGNVNQDPERLVPSGKQIDGLFQRRQGIGPPVADAGRVRGLVDPVIVDTKDLDLLFRILAPLVLSTP